MWPEAMALTFDFPGHILKDLYPRNGRTVESTFNEGDVSRTHVVTLYFCLIHNLDLGEGTRVDRVLKSTYDLELWTCLWIFKVKYWKSCIPGVGLSIDIDPKECELIGSRTHFMTLNVDEIYLVKIRNAFLLSTHKFWWTICVWVVNSSYGIDIIRDLDLVFSKSNLKITFISGMGCSIDNLCWGWVGALGGVGVGGCGVGVRGNRLGMWVRYDMFLTLYKYTVSGSI